MTGSEVKQLIKSSNLKCWQVADKWGLSDGNFSRKLRKPFNENEVHKLKSIINQLTAERSTEHNE